LRVNSGVLRFVMVFPLVVVVMLLAPLLRCGCFRVCAQSGALCQPPLSVSNCGRWFV